MTKEKQITTNTKRNTGLIVNGGNYLKFSFFPPMTEKRQIDIINLNNLITRYLVSKGYSIGARLRGSSIHGSRPIKKINKEYL